jgi:hypothetical protein
VVVEGSQRRELVDDRKLGVDAAQQAVLAVGALAEELAPGYAVSSADAEQRLQGVAIAVRGAVDRQHHTAGADVAFQVADVVGPQRLLIAVEDDRIEVGEIGKVTAGRGGVDIAFAREDGGRDRLGPRGRGRADDQVVAAGGLCQVHEYF